MEQTQPSQSPAQPPQPASSGTPGPQKSGSKIWLWIIGGCLAIVIIAGLIMGGLAWWGARKVKKAIKENQPKWEEMQKGAQDAQQELQKQMENVQKQIPNSGTPSSE
jgi:uncharacterized protein HemX